MRPISFPPGHRTLRRYRRRLGKKRLKRFKIPIPEPPSEVTWHQAHPTAGRRQIRNHGPALLPEGTDPDVGQQTNTNLHRSLLDLRGTRSCAERVLLAFGELLAHWQIITESESI